MFKTYGKQTIYTFQRYIHYVQFDSNKTDACPYVFTNPQATKQKTTDLKHVAHKVPLLRNISTFLSKESGLRCLT